MHRMWCATGSPGAWRRSTWSTSWTRSRLVSVRTEVERQDALAAAFKNGSKPLPGSEKQAAKSAALHSAAKRADESEPTDLAQGIEAPRFSDDAIALKAAERHQHDRRFIAPWGRYLAFDGSRWADDKTLDTLNCIRAVCREVAVEKKDRAFASAKKVSAVDYFFRADRRIAATVDQWDTDLFALNTPGGTIDLRTGENRPHVSADYMTKITGVAPDDNCPTPIWLAFMARIFNGDNELIRFVQRAAGYALTGSTAEHSLFFLYGSGANGKSTLLNALQGCMGNYHKVAPIETFTAGGRDRHPTDLAMLRGARLVTAVETDEGRQWAESKIKALTGGDKISARFMKQDFFEYTPMFKLWVAGNHKPGLRSVDEAIRRRFNLIPFTVTIPEAERDHTLGDQLKAEFPGILAWMIDGCLQWQRIGLSPPEAVRAATAAYLEAEDALSAWVEESCVREVETWESSAALYKSWKAWAERAGEHPCSLKKFSQRLEDRSAAFGIEKRRDGGGHRGFAGLRLLRSDLMASTPPEGSTP